MLFLVKGTQIQCVSVDDVKEHLRLNTRGEDRYLESLIQSATDIIENMTGRSLLKKTFRFIGGRDGKITLPKPPILEILNVYTTFPKQLVKRYRLDRDVVFYHAPLGSLEVTYEAGYGDLPQSIPAPLRHGILTLCADLYENRGHDTIFLNNLLQNYILYRV